MSLGKARRSGFRATQCPVRRPGTNGGQRIPTIGLVCLEIAGARQPPRFGQNRAYVRALSLAGAAPLLIAPRPDVAQLRRLYDLCEGLLLPGGGDVDPGHYGETVHEKCGRISPVRDQVELALARWATAENKPVLAICRGIQVLNVALGGSLYQDIAAEIPDADRHDWYPGHRRNRLSHPVYVARGSRLAQIVGEGPLPVNSLHHQALRAVAPGLSVSGHAPDGIVEGVEAADHPFAIGVQWHPEELAEEDRRQQALFDALVEACRG